jgi:hypothetical protein
MLTGCSCCLSYAAFGRLAVTLHRLSTFIELCHRPLRMMDANPWGTPSVRGGNMSATPAAAIQTPQVVPPSAAGYRHQAYMDASTPHTQTASRPIHPSSFYSIDSTPLSTIPSTPTSSAGGGVFAPPPRSTIRARVLEAASSLGLYGWPSPPAPAPKTFRTPVSPQFDAGDSVSQEGYPVPAPKSFRAPMSPQFDTGESTSLADYSVWLSHASAIRCMLEEENAAHEQLWKLDHAIGEHEREQDVREVVAKQSIDAQANQVWEWAQHLAALMSSDAAPVSSRNPQPSQWHLIARGAREGQFTAAPTFVHPALRSLLQPPVSSFIHVEPELQDGLREGVESMCRDVRQWKAPRARLNEEQPTERNDAITTPPDALAWTSTLQAQQKPLVSSKCAHPLVSRRHSCNVVMGHILTRSVLHLVCCICVGLHPPGRRQQLVSFAAGRRWIEQRTCRHTRVARA